MTGTRAVRSRHRRLPCGLEGCSRSGGASTPPVAVDTWPRCPRRPGKFMTSEMRRPGGQLASSPPRLRYPRLVRWSATTPRTRRGSTIVEGASRGRACSTRAAHSSWLSTSRSTASTGWSARASTRTTRSAVAMRDPAGRSGFRGDAVAVAFVDDAGIDRHGLAGESGGDEGVDDRARHGAVHPLVDHRVDDAVGAPARRPDQTAPRSGENRTTSLHRRALRGGCSRTGHSSGDRRRPSPARGQNGSFRLHGARAGGPHGADGGRTR